MNHVTHQDLDSKESFTSITSVNGEFYWKAGRDTSCIKTRSAGTDFTSIMSRQGFYLKGTGRAKVLKPCIHSLSEDKESVCDQLIIWLLL